MALAFAFVFVAHLFIFAALGMRRGEWRFLVLAGTFAFLSVLYGLKAVRPGTPGGWLLVLRGGAIVCTVSYLTLSARREGTWVQRLMKRLRRSNVA